MLGWRALFFVVVLGAVSGSLISIPILLWTRRRGAGATPSEPLHHVLVPFGPFLAGAAVVQVLVGPRLLTLIADLLAG